MKTRTNPLEHVRVAAPCSADWEQMHGSEKVRFCAECNLSVYNLSEMTKKEAERLIVQNEGWLCVRFYRRTDGTILTNNCPVGLRAIKRRLSRTANAVVSMVLSFFAGILAFAGLRQLDPAVIVTQGTMVASPSYIPRPERREIIGDIQKIETVTGTMAYQPESDVKKRSKPKLR
ncbi:MAG: hypothetical protein ICV68_03060 [Pyrinomonadaceae bacterium]|nr:hypothetical protein [Pyrinomonadaceae bacterium]